MNIIPTKQKKHYGTIVIGGGQAGLATGYYLSQKKVDFLIVEAGPEVGNAWRKRWDSLKLFTPNRFNGLPGMSFPGNAEVYSSKDGVADFISQYSRKFNFPLVTNTTVTRLSKNIEGFELQTSSGIFNCNNIIIATGAYAIPTIPAISNELDPGIFQLHSLSYKRPSLLPAGNTLVVGAGTSGIQIALDIAASGRMTWVAGKPTFRIPPLLLRYFDKPMIWFMNNILTLKTIPGRKAAFDMKVNGGGAPLINISIQEAVQAGVTHVQRISAVKDGYPVTEDGAVLKPSSILWCTGFKPDVRFIDIENITDSHGYPLEYRGVASNVEGLYYVGMKFQFALTSSWIKGVGRDAAYVVNHIISNTLNERKFTVRREKLYSEKIKVQ